MYSEFLKYDPEDTGLLPEGDYTATIIECKQCQTKSGDGMYLEFEFRIDEGNHTGKQFKHLITTHNKTLSSQSAGRQELAQLMYALNVPNPTSESSFCNIRLIVTVGTRDNTYNGRTTKYNCAVGYKPYQFNNTSYDNTQRPY